MNYIYAASGAIIAIFIILILNKDKKNTADYLLILVNFLIGCFLLADVLVNWKLTSATVVVQNGVPLLLFPVFVFYLLQFTHAKKTISPWWYAIFSPFVLFITLSMIDHFYLKNYQTHAQINQHFNAPDLPYQLIFKGSQILFISLLIYLIKTLNSFEQELKKGYSTIETIDVIWLKRFTLIYLTSITITFVLFLGQNLGLIPFDVKQVFAIVYGLLVFSVFYMNYHGIQHYTLSQVYPSKTSEPEETMAINLDENYPTLTAEEQELERKILAQIEEQQLYLEPKFSLDDLAENLGESKHLVSKVINAGGDRSFYDLINGYRVEHLKKLLDDPQNASLTILSLGLDSGFNSKASLNRIFKNISGLTPRQYLDQRSQSAGNTTK